VGEDDRSAQVDLDRAVDLLERERVQGAGSRQGGVGDQDVDVSGLADQALQLGTGAEVNGERACAELGGQPLQHLAAAAGQDQLRATGAE
jgi:hypothetical protein